MPPNKTSPPRPNRATAAGSGTARAGARIGPRPAEVAQHDRQVVDVHRAVAGELALRPDHPRLTEMAQHDRQVVDVHPAVAIGVAGMERRGRGVRFGDVERPGGEAEQPDLIDGPVEALGNRAAVVPAADQNVVGYGGKVGCGHAAGVGPHRAARIAGADQGVVHP